jgi:TatD DNase family protein
MLFDAHNHIQAVAFDGCLPEVLARAAGAGVGRMMACGTGAKGDWERLLRLDDTHRQAISVSIGLHPWYVATADLGWKVTLEKILEDRPFRIGEIGLDKSSRADAGIEDQMKAFLWQLDLAEERGLPVSIHCVGAWDYLHEALARRDHLRYMLHSFHGSPELTETFARKGAYFSIGPRSLSAGKRTPEACLAKIPPERLLIETDAPDSPLPEAIFPTGPNEPARLRDVCTRAARLTGKSVEELEKLTFDNTERFFSIP